jgi:hypothetical protein
MRLGLDLQRLVLVVLLAFTIPSKAVAQDSETTDTAAVSEGAAPTKSAEEIAREMSNPVGNLASMVFQGTYSSFDGSLSGADEQSASALIFMPTLPFKLGSGNLVIRPSFPVASVPTINGMGEWEDIKGFGDIVLLANWGTKKENGFLWGGGVTSIFPTAKEGLGQEQLQLGPSAIVGILKKWGVLGAFWQHWWGISPPDGIDKANKGTLQLFYWFSLAGGWQVGGSPMPTANYVTATDVDFSLPLNFGVAKTFMLGSTPLKATVQFQYFVTRPEAVGPSHGIFFQIAPVVKVPW